MRSQRVTIAVLATIVTMITLLSGTAITQAQGPIASAGPDDAVVAMAARVLNMAQVQLKEALQDGQTIADIAKSKGIPLNTVAAAIQTQFRAMLKTAVQAKTMTQAQADALMARLRERLTAQLQAKVGEWQFGWGEVSGGKDDTWVCPCGCCTDTTNTPLRTQDRDRTQDKTGDQDQTQDRTRDRQGR